MGTATFSGNGNYYLDVDAALVSQNIAGNYSTIYWRIDVVKTYGYGHQASGNTGSNGYVDSSVGGLWGNGNLQYNFQNGSMTGRWTFADGTFNVQHRSDGTAEYEVHGGMHLILLGDASAGTGWRSLPRLANVPNAPSSLTVDQQTQTSLRYLFRGNGDGGSPILEWQALYQEAPNGPQIAIGGEDGHPTVYGLKPATTYNFWSRGRNAVGWGPWSSPISGTTLSGAKIKIGGTWRDAVPYVKTGGVWRLAEPYVKSGGIWKKTS